MKCSTCGKKEFSERIIKINGIKQCNDCARVTAKQKLNDILQNNPDYCTPKDCTSKFNVKKALNNNAKNASSKSLVIAIISFVAAALSLFYIKFVISEAILVILGIFLVIGLISNGIHMLKKFKNYLSLNNDDNYLFQVSESIKHCVYYSDEIIVCTDYIYKRNDLTKRIPVNAHISAIISYPSIDFHGIGISESFKIRYNNGYKDLQFLMGYLPNLTIEYATNS